MNYTTAPTKRMARVASTALHIRDFRKAGVIRRRSAGTMDVQESTLRTAPFYGLQRAKPGASKPSDAILTREAQRDFVSLLWSRAGVYFPVRLLLRLKILSWFVETVPGSTSKRLCDFALSICDPSRRVGPWSPTPPLRKVAQCYVSTPSKAGAGGLHRLTMRLERRSAPQVGKTA